jgi:hypothetical protein
LQVVPLLREAVGEARHAPHITVKLKTGICDGWLSISGAC